ncbi:MAG: LysR family transcriptional regulator [Lachnospiraceae bacterium]|nr:LysR family transcriptional regulator [Lachnospiraceae bacterium]
MQNNLNLYYIFYEVGKAGNISKAAKALYISQPAISKAISKLEESLKTTLFIRNSRGVTLTTSGEILFNETERAFRSIEAGENKIRLADKLGVGHLTIGVSTTLCKHVLLPSLKSFVQKNPHIKISIHCMSSYDTLEALEDNRLDIGIVGYSTLKNSNLHVIPMMKIHDVFVASDNYLNNFRLRSAISSEAIEKEATFMMLDADNITRKYVDNSLAQNNIILSNIIEVSNMDLLIDFAKTDLGISAVIKEFVLKDLQNGLLKEVPIMPSNEGRQVGIVYNENKFRENPSIELFAEECSNNPIVH